jgi:SsrA-binding protein
MAVSKLIANNKKARHEYFIEDVIEVGLVLKGTEVKSIRMGKANIKESYAVIKQGEIFIQGMHISPYEMGNRFNEDPLRVRKLLLHKREINKLIGLTQQKGYTLAPLRLYLNEKGLVKLEIGIAKGKKLHDKRHDLAKKDANRDIQRALRDKQRY